MKFSSKSMLSLGRARDSSQSQISLSTSLSRRLRNSVSLKRGQASPMFTPTTNGKKRGSSLENPEPSSPKVTCIGQVRVKTKKQGKKKKIRAARSRREVSFRRTGQGTNLDTNHHYQDFGHTSHHQFQQPQQECLPYRNQRWFHLPVTICEALRAFGAEFSCLWPCKSSCMESNNNKQRDNKGGKVTTHHSNGNVKANGSDSSCGAVFVRWLVVEEEQRNGSDNDEDDMPRRSQRRHVFEDILIEGDDNKCEQKNEILEEEEEEERGASICIPPKNALLLMRCRSDPVKMAALANRFWECPPPPFQDEDENKVEEEEDTEQVKVEEEHQVICEKLVFSNQIIEENKIPDAEAVEEAEIEAESKEIIEVQEEEEEEENVPSETFTEALADPGLLNEHENVLEDEQAFDDINEKRPSLSCQQEAEAEVVVVAEEDSTEEETAKVHEISEPGDPEMTQKPETGQEKLLPDCLLLMMCEPKLSMEVSKETWVCSTDFVRCQPSEKKPLPEKVNKTDGSDEQPRKKASIGAAKPAPLQRQLLMQPPRSSCSFPAAPPLPPALGAPSVRTMNIIIEQKLLGAKPSSQKPVALTRCKSEPRKSSAKLAPETCFWKNRKIEPHHPATLGIGAAGVGF